jgi:cytochrome c oxidase subunit 2
MKVITGNKDFVYEIACDQMCGKGHYSMRGTVIVQTEADFKKWIEGQKSYYDVQHAPKEAAPAAGTTAPEKMKAIATDSTKTVAKK